MNSSIFSPAWPGRRRYTAKILLGGDHLGPKPWRQLAADKAMAKAASLIYEYVKAGFQKIHLDASMYLADDQRDRNRPLAEEIVAARTAELCSSAEQAWKRFNKGGLKPVHIIGTEVPAPGGARQDTANTVTLPEDAARTLAVAIIGRTRNCKRLRKNYIST